MDLIRKNIKLVLVATSFFLAHQVTATTPQEVQQLIIEGDTEPETLVFQRLMTSKIPHIIIYECPHNAWVDAKKECHSLLTLTEEQYNQFGQKLQKSIDNVSQKNTFIYLSNKHKRKLGVSNSLETATFLAEKADSSLPQIFAEMSGDEESVRSFFDDVVAPLVKKVLFETRELVSAEPMTTSSENYKGIKKEIDTMAQSQQSNSK